MEGLATAAGHEDRQAPLKNYRQLLHHLVAKAPWSDAVLLEQVRSYVLPAMQKQGPVVAWIVDDTGFPKKASIRSASRGNTAVKWVSRRTAVSP
jgi:SRSO17 transposase